jgi:hypothetical protein
VQPADWFLTAAERGNPATRIDARHGDGTAWTAGNTVTPLIHGGTYFAELESRVAAMTAGDLLLFTDWRGDGNQVTNDAGTSVSALLCAATGRRARPEPRGG